ncbi:uncharacterized protein LOC105427981 [Pogonomyrmex barbatus]|uniref:Uncharacterized protein LOC105427981 n=1 Tax=Pogonomyrmex barbatus TaxID=144034 RepID=A0A6I9X1W8_9HYME|nr:uncharacterized protein LOC105427981 [Pogonomyrmex barbatus]
MLLAQAVTFVVAVVALAGAAEEKKCERNILWTGGSFEWPCPVTKSMFQNSGRYISKNVLATRAAIYKDDAILALPRDLSSNKVMLGNWISPCSADRTRGTHAAYFS